MENAELIPSSTEAESAVFALPSAMTIETVEALASAIDRRASSPAGTLALDAANTEILSTPGIQLLMALDKTFTQAGGRISLLNANEQVADAFRVLGLEEQFNTWSNNNG